MTQPNYADGGWTSTSRFVWEPGDIILNKDLEPCLARYPGCSGWKRKTSKQCGYCGIKKRMAEIEDDGA